MCRQASEDYDKEHARAQATIMSYMLEAGIIFHSIFIGIGYGASTDLAVIRPLTVALAFHQARLPTLQPLSPCRHFPINARRKSDIVLQDSNS